ncbi:ATP synthase-coupling factor 6, mitochondrial isoform X2 [Marmota marmota marmota]|uniref:ATP synthase peripheral stalk subunit F6, mitochondrial n=1 Tax=Marmota marmota marmota TaxID=9994 RepID=A0A8C5ZTE2_MARMA|nr:ATP synthase-coupling factor 6, mitochondrial isoform X2 [Marmota marmota marmota]
MAAHNALRWRVGGGAEPGPEVQLWRRRWLWQLGTECKYHRITMVLQRLFKFSSVIRSAVSVHLKRNIGVTAVAFNKDLDPIQKLFVDKIREYKTKRQASGGPVDTGPEYQQDLERELFKLKQMYGKVDMNTFPNFKFEDPKFEAIEKPQS